MVNAAATHPQHHLSCEAGRSDLLLHWLLCWRRCARGLLQLHMAVAAGVAGVAVGGGDVAALGLPGGLLGCSC